MNHISGFPLTFGLTCRLFVPIILIVQNQDLLCVQMTSENSSREWGIHPSCAHSLEQFLVCLVTAGVSLSKSLLNEKYAIPLVIYQCYQ